MALIKCPECGLENVSSSAIACPNCSFPIKDSYDLYVAKQKILIGTAYCDVSTGIANMFFENGVEVGAVGKCIAFDIWADYSVDVDGSGVYIKGDNINGRWSIFEDYLLAPAGPYRGEIPNGERFSAICSSILVKCDNLSFYPNGTFSETISGKTTTGVYVRKGNLIAIAEKDSPQVRVYVVKNHCLWLSSHIQKEKVYLLTEISKECIEYASKVENQSIPVTPCKETVMDAPKKEEKSVGGTIAKIWFWIICAFVGGFAFISAEHMLFAAICFIVFPIIAIWTYIMGPSSLHKMMDDDAKKQYDKKMNGGYTCPNCGRKAGHPISAISKSVSVGALGLASNKIGKSYKCENCGYMW